MNRVVEGVNDFHKKWYLIIFFLLVAYPKSYAFYFDLNIFYMTISRYDFSTPKNRNSTLGLTMHAHNGTLRSSVHKRISAYDETLQEYIFSLL